MRKIDEIIIHCSATKEGKDFNVDDIRRWHVNGNGWVDVGYHFVIRLDGRIEVGRPITMKGAHTTNHNANSVGICYVGGLDENGKAKDTRTEAQKKALRELCHQLKCVFPTIDKVHGHNYYAAKACPCFKVEDEFDAATL